MLDFQLLVHHLVYEATKLCPILYMCVKLELISIVAGLKVDQGHP